MAMASTRLAWICSTCQAECIPIRSESRCLCGHRHKEHGDASSGWQCNNAKCACRAFFYIAAQGAWILRCRCKHKHIEHNAASHACDKPGCGCASFDSPWVCNCNHPWAEHKQAELKVPQAAAAQQLGTAAGFAGLVAAAAEVNAWGRVRRGVDAAD